MPQLSSSDRHIDPQIVFCRDEFLSRLPSDHITYQLTIVLYRKFADDKNEVKSVLETIYKRLNETYVHPRRYSKFRHLMPWIFAIIETDNKVFSHIHALVAIDPSLAEKIDALDGYKTFQQFDARVKTSHFARTIADAVDVDAFDVPTNVKKWLNYLTKQKNVRKKSLDDVITYPYTPTKP